MNAWSWYFHFNFLQLNVKDANQIRLLTQIDPHPPTINSHVTHTHTCVMRYVGIFNAYDGTTKFNIHQLRVLFSPQNSYSENRKEKRFFVFLTVAGVYRCRLIYVRFAIISADWIETLLCHQQPYTIPGIEITKRNFTTLKYMYVQDVVRAQSTDI